MDNLPYLNKTLEVCHGVWEGGLRHTGRDGVANETAQPDYTRSGHSHLCKHLLHTGLVFLLTEIILEIRSSGTSGSIS